MKTALLSFSAAIILFFASCVKDAGTGTSTINFQLKAAVSPVNGAGIVWSAGAANVATTKFEAKKNDVAVEFKAEPKTLVDLFGLVSISNIAIPTGTFRSVEFKSILQPLNSKPALYLEGNYTAGGVTTPVYLEVGTEVVISAKRDSVVIASASTNYTALTTLGLITLTNDVTEADMKAAARVAGKIPLTLGVNPFVYNKILANLAKTQVIEFK
jgi:hypothetical protein